MEKVAKNFLYLGTENVATNWRGQTLEEITINSQESVLYMLIF